LFTRKVKDFCKALSQSQIEGIAFVSIPPTTCHPPATQKSKDSILCQALSQSQTILGFLRWKATSKIEDDLSFSKMEDKLNFFKN
jgi:hypothetical protein